MEITSKKTEGGLFQVKMAVLACMVLHNVCLDQGDTIPAKLDLSIDPDTRQVRDRAGLRELLMIKSSHKVVDPSSTTEANIVRNAIVEKLWNQRQEGNNYCSSYHIELFDFYVHEISRQELLFCTHL